MRRFLDEIRTDITTLLPDNTTGEILPASFRTILNDIIDSTITDESAIYSTAPTLNEPTTTAFTPLTGIFDAQVGGDGVFLKPDFASGTIVTNTVAGFSYQASGEVSFEGQNNVQYNFVLTVNGVNASLIGEATGRGAGRPVSVSLVDFLQSAASDSVYGLSVQSPDGVNDIDISQAAVRLDVLPTNNP